MAAIFTKKISAKGLAIFRIAYCLNFLFEIIEIFNHRQLYFDRLPYIDVHFPDTKLLMLLWMTVLVFMIIGLYTRTVTIINYLFTLIFISSMTNYSYHMFYVYIGINFLLIFLPISRFLSIDIVLKKLKYLNQGLIYVPSKVSKINYLLPVFMGLGIVYLDSVIFYKMQSPMWLGGLGMWLPSSLPHVSIADTQWILNQEFLIKFLSHLTIVFEFLFVFIFWNKKFRIPLLIIGLGLHLGIYIEYPIPYFAFGCISIYFLMVPVSWWDRIWRKITSKKESLVIYYDDSNLPSHKLKLIIQSLDILNRIKFVNHVYDKESTSESSEIGKGKTYGVDVNNVSYTGKNLLEKIVKASPMCYPVLLLNKINLYKNTFDTNSNSVVNKIELLKFIQDDNPRSYNRNRIRNGILVSFFFLSIISQVQVHYSFFGSSSVTHFVDKSLVKYFGICKHPVFMDNHFRGYHQVYGLKYKDSFLPILDEKGMPGDYLKGGTYVNWMWVVNAPNIKENAYSLKKGFVDYTSFWSYRNAIDLTQKQEFEIVKKRIKVSFKWERDLLHKNIDSPWEKAGVLIWENKTPQLFWNSNAK
ncbi:hypothetical protein [Aquimarina macrocephali]|uniref:hypothetical protein n=1 Tax=Aquimarina macrocephali TaxID=666563 RepID=UPI003F66489E